MVGVGLVGFVVARVLYEVGRDVVVFEVFDGVGGWVCTDFVDGFCLDRGF